MSLEVLDRHSEALFEFLWCPVCGHEVFSHIPFEGVFCKNCNTQVVLRESQETRGYEEAILACFDTDTTWNFMSTRSSVVICPMDRHGPRSSGREMATRLTGGVRSQVKSGSRSNVVNLTTSKSQTVCRTWRSRVQSLSDWGRCFLPR